MPCTLPTILVAPSVQLVHFIQDIIYSIQYILYYFTVLTRAQAQRRRRMVEESTIYEASGNKNTLDTINDSIFAAMNNIFQALATLQVGNKSTKATQNHSPVLNPFSYDLTLTSLPVLDQLHLSLPVYR